MADENPDECALGLDMSEDAFAALVDEALQELPETMTAGIDNVAIFIADEPEDGSELLGLYEGTDLTERDDYGFGDLPDQITLFRLPLLRACEDEEELKEQIYITIVHEIAHHYGIDDAELHELGWT